MRGTPHHATATAAAQTLAAPAAPGAEALASSEFARELRAGLAHEVGPACLHELARHLGLR